ncbi:MFS transporter [Clostridium estertheticum]|uniref:MFS transporter n=1 Tax=Clostridium estertheticum TaxID=238834 RepID=UPI0013E953D0|nr:MFS transporter [Clostridium estertheticum]MBZ9686328.1 MFS transporter [Clostridium estertheticum]
MKSKTSTIAMIIFLLGIFMGAIDSGIVSPARTIISNFFGISGSSSVWVITIYTLAYAVSMPITAKLSDRHGRKKVYMISISLFAFGSLLCGLSNFINSYNFLLFSRVIQALGGGGIMPIAIAYIGSSFPLEKRGTALGLVGAIFGISTILGPTIGSFVLSIAGDANWGFLFFINLPISLVILTLALNLKENKNEKPIKKMDLKGCGALTIVILSLMYSATNLKFHDLANSISSKDVLPFLLIFLISLPIFILIEKKAEDPVLNLHYFTNKQIAITLALSFVVGTGLMGTIFLPQFGENILKIKMGTGGYIVTLFAVFTGISAPLGGKFIDKMGVKKVLLAGFGFSFIGALYQALVTANHPSFFNLFIGLIFMGLGMGLTMGTPINYLMMSLVPEEEASAGQSTVSLIRSIGIAISPNLLVNFIATAGSKVPGAIQAVLPKVNGVPGNGAFSGKMSAETITKFQNSDVTTIFNTVREFVGSMIDGLKSTLASNPHVNFNAIKTGYLSSVDSSRATIENTYQSTMNAGFSNVFIGAAVIAAVGLLLTLFIKDKKLTKIT